MAASHQELIYFIQFLEFIYLLKIQELKHPLVGSRVNLRPTTGWTIGIIKYVLAHTLLFVGFNWKSIPEVSTHKIDVWALQVFFEPFQPRRIYLQFRSYIYVRLRLAYNYEKNEFQYGR